MLTHLAPTATGAEIAAILRRDGGVIVDDLASDELLAVRAEPTNSFVP